MTEKEIRAVFEKAADAGEFKGKKVLAIFPDHTRSGPVPTFFKAFCDIVGKSAKKLDFIIALGTHMPMTDPMLEEHLGYSQKPTKYGIFNHEWDNPQANRQVGVLTKKEVEELSGGLMSLDVRVSINKKVFDYDLLTICGPVFPHEVVGFSGGHKYLFPGISEGEVLHFFHWLGALITNPRIIGTRDTPVRAVIERCAALVPTEKRAFCYVVNHGKVEGVFFDEPQKAWRAAAELSDKLHITYLDKPFQTVLSGSPKMYDDVWTAGKCMYKMECVVADGGTLIIYAPHITEISYTHGKLLDRIGYHTRDYFAKQMDKFKDVPMGILAHSTHVRGIGTFENGVEKPRVKVVLASRVSRERCERINLGYMNPDEIDVKKYENREEEGILYIPKAGEMLYKLKSRPAWQRF